ncbi:amidohydrolase [Reinekea marinisedimentorum]|uniref:Amidohydrolase 3 domain-containing protein n=1 Tax=Reinekea marinisedimentorum TaxID=230495 RepID=A0A4V2UIE7_9GAMM|nr:amidohydrolase family protein [Reinekea marinisedimentorum]TCS35880.1 hypothetical protein BCF53_13015 [Reinekea marinisedimentorum]
MTRIKLSMLLAMALPMSALAAPPSADTVLIGGKVLTADDSFTIAESLAIKDGRIVAVGSNSNVSAYIGAETHIIELDGKTVIPGLIDNHFHFVRSAWNFQNEARLDGVDTRAEALAILKAKAAEAEPGDWITVIGGWSPRQFQDDSSSFTLAELDSVSKTNPVYLLQSYSSGYANSAAFAETGTENTGSAELSGRNGLTPFTNAVSWSNKAASREAILNYMAELNRLGLTAVYDSGRESDGDLTPIGELAAEGPMPLRVFHTLRYNAADAPAAVNLIEGMSPNTKNDYYGLIGLGEHIYSPVQDSPNVTAMWPDATWAPFSDISWAAAKNGWSVHEHVMSNATAVQFLDLIEDIAEEVPQVKELRWTIAHANGMTDAEIARAKDLGVAIGVHAQARMSFRTVDKPPIGSISRSGVLWGLGSDGAIVSSYNPFHTLGWAVTGKNIAQGIGWGDTETVSREEALLAHTNYNAKLIFMEDDLGTLEVGKLADLVVLNEDYLTVPEDDIAHLLPVLTMTAGEVVFEK